MSTKTIESYITSTSKGTHVDAKHLVTEEQRKQANGVRIVEDPVAVKNKAAEVCAFFFPFTIFDDENLSQFST